VIEDLQVRVNVFDRSLHRFTMDAADRQTAEE
jgi:hypothetical protein